MPYDNRFEIKITEDCDLEAVRQVVANLASEKCDDYDVFVVYESEDFIRTDGETKWGEWTYDMLQISKALPHLTFNVYREGEEGVDYEHGVFRNGSFKVVKGFVSYPAINDEDLAKAEPNRVAMGYYAAYVRDQEGTVIIKAKTKIRATEYFQSEYGKRNLLTEVGVPTAEAFALHQLLGHDIETIA